MVRASRKTQPQAASISDAMASTRNRVPTTRPATITTNSNASKLQPPKSKIPPPPRDRDDQPGPRIRHQETISCSKLWFEVKFYLPEVLRILDVPVAELRFDGSIDKLTSDSIQGLARKRHSIRFQLKSQATRCGEQQLGKRRCGRHDLPDEQANIDRSNLRTIRRAPPSPPSRPVRVRRVPDRASDRARRSRSADSQARHRRQGQPDSHCGPIG